MQNNIPHQCLPDVNGLHLPEWEPAWSCCLGFLKSWSPNFLEGSKLGEVNVGSVKKHWNNCLHSYEFYICQLQPFHVVRRYMEKEYLQMFFYQIGALRFWRPHPLRWLSVSWHVVSAGSRTTPHFTWHIEGLQLQVLTHPQGKIEALLLALKDLQTWGT